MSKAKGMPYKIAKISALMPFEPRPDKNRRWRRPRAQDELSTDRIGAYSQRRRKISEKVMNGYTNGNDRKIWCCTIWPDNGLW